VILHAAAFPDLKHLLFLVSVDDHCDVKLIVMIQADARMVRCRYGILERLAPYIAIGATIIF
jgi:hypothetical protein